MIKTRLKSEFMETRPAENPKDPPVPTEEYKQREAAFEDFDRHVSKDPSLVARVMGYVARGVTLGPEHQVIAKAGELVLDTSNNGTQIGFDKTNGDKLWGVIFDDSDHRETASAYHLARKNRGEHSAAAKLLSRKRGAHTLRVYAQEQVQEKPVATPTPPHAQAA